MPFKNLKCGEMKIIDIETNKEITLKEIAEFETCTLSELENYNFPIPFNDNKQFTFTVIGKCTYRLPLKHRMFFKLKTIAYKLKEMWRRNK